MSLGLSKLRLGFAVYYPPITSGDVTTTFGNLTLEGAGGVAVTGTSISSGDASGHWQISGGFLSPSAAGETANLNLGPYSLTLDDGQTVAITIEADTYTVRSEAEIAAVVALGSATVSGKTIAVRQANITWGDNNWFDSENYTSTVTLKNADVSPPVFRGTYYDSGTLRASRLGSVGNMVLDGITISHEIDRRYITYSTKAFEITGANTSSVVIKNCLIYGDLLSKGYGPGYVGFNGGATLASTASVSFINNTMYGLRRPISFAQDVVNLTIKGNTIYDFGLDAIQFGRTTTALDVSWNLAYNPFGSQLWQRFEDQNDYLFKSTELTGAADGKTMTLFVAWRNMRDIAATGNATEYLFAQDDKVVLYRRGSDGRLVFEAKNTGGATSISMVSTSVMNETPNGAGLARGVIIEVDTDATSRMYVWDEHTGAWASEATAASNGDTLDLTGGNCYLMSDNAGTSLSYFTEIGRIALWQGVAADATSTAVQDSLIDGTNPEFMPARTDAVTEIGTPIVDFVGNQAYWATAVNLGSDGSTFSKNGSVEVGHGDLFQGVPGGDIIGMTAFGNRGLANRNDSIESILDHQGLFVEDISGFDNVSPVVAGNFIVTTNTVHGISLYNSQGGQVFGNTVVPLTDLFADDSFSDSPRINLIDHGTGNESSNNEIYDNVAFSIGTGSGTGNVEGNNVDADFEGLNGTLFTSLFDGPAWTSSALTTMALATTAYTPLTSGTLNTSAPKIGAINAYTDFTNRTIDHPRFNTVGAFTFTDQTDVTASTVIESDIVQITNIDMVVDDSDLENRSTTTASVNGALVSVNTGEFRIVNDASGTSVDVDWGTSDAVIEQDQYLQLRQTSSGGSEVQTDQVVTVGTASDTWSVTTEAAGPGPSVTTELSFIANLEENRGSASSGDATFASASLGAADTNRRIVVAVSHLSNGGEVSGVTVDGAPGTLLVSDYVGSGTDPATSIWAASVPSGTTGDIVVSFDGNTFDISVGTYRLIKSAGTTAYDTDTSNATGAISMGVNTTVDGACLAISQRENGSSQTWTGVTEDYDTDIRSGEWHRVPASGSPVR